MDQNIIEALEKELASEQARLEALKPGTLEYGRQMDLVRQIANQSERYRMQGENELR